MILKNINLFFLIGLLNACTILTGGNKLQVNNPDELVSSIEVAKPGDEIILANGIWNDVEIIFSAKGTKDNPIILRAETAGQVFIEGKSYLKIAGEYLIVDGLYFKNGYSPSEAVIEFRVNRESNANNCTVKNTVIIDFVKPNRYDADLWVQFWGRHNSLDHSYIEGKFNHGPTVRINLDGNEHINNYHQITNNYFGPRPRKGGPSAETIQIGNSYTSMTPSYSNISNNFFDRCNGEVEVISSKTNFNEFKNNIFFECEGSLVFRHGNYCLADGNIFIGDKNSQFNGGIRVINTGHWVTNNYFFDIKGDEFRSSLAIMNGIPSSPQNRYNQVTDAVVAYNTWIDCQSPWQFSVGQNVDKKDVLPESEIRSARPRRTIMANNIIYNNDVDETPIVAYDKVDGIEFQNNIIDNKGGDFIGFDGLEAESLDQKKINEWLYVPAEQSDVLNSVYQGFEFEKIKNDLFGNSRKAKNTIGAITDFNKAGDFNIDKTIYGPSWYSKETHKAPQTISVTIDGNISKMIVQAGYGDILELASGKYNIDEALIINKKITIKGIDREKKTQLIYSGSSDSPVFEMNPKAILTLENIILQGKGDQYAFATLEENMSMGYNLYVENSEISGFETILKSYKGSFADTISFSNSTLKNSSNGIELAAEVDNRGDYNAEFVYIKNCELIDIQKNVINYHRGGYDESTIGGNLLVNNSQFKNCGKNEESKILIKTHGIINVDISKNSFQNNPVELIALLWGEKNNSHSDNKTNNSGNIKVEQKLKQKLLY